MATKSLSELIREVTEHAKPRVGFEALITIDTHTGQAVNHRSFIDTITGNYRYFLVANSADKQKVVSGAKVCKYKEGSGEVSFRIGYEGGCEPGHEAWFAHRFYSTGRSRSDEDLRDALARWLIEFFSQQGRTVDDFPDERHNAVADLTTRAGQEFGLNLAITLELDGEKLLESIEQDFVASCRLKHFDEEKILSVKVELEVDRHRIIRALLNRDADQSTELLTKGIRRYFAERVTLDDYYDAIGSERIRQDLARDLDQQLQPLGRKIGFLSLRADEQRPDSFKGETTIEYAHHEYPDPIKIDTSALINVTDEARYRAKGSPLLAQWLELHLNQVIPLVLFGVSYVDLLLEFQGLKEKIDALMKQRAAEIGCTIEQLMTIVFLEPFEWLKGFDVEINQNANGRPSEAMFETSLQNFDVGLEIFLTARVRDLRGVQDYLTKKQKVPVRMKEEIIRLTRRFLRGTDPERFYMRYSKTDEQEYQGEIPFETELREKIHHLVETEFNSIIIDLVLKPLHTDVTRKLESISRKSHDFVATSELGVLPGAPAISIIGSFRVNAVCDWKTFRESEISIEGVRKRIETGIRAFLKRLRANQITFDDGGFEELIGARLPAAAIKLIGNEFGLRITLPTIYWDWEESIKTFGKQQRNKELAAIQQRISRLRDRLLEYREEGAEAELTEPLEEGIRRLSAMLTPPLAASLGINQLPEPKISGSLTSGDLKEDGPQGETK